MLTTVYPDTETQSLTLMRAELIRLLDRARHVVPTRFPKPILTCVHLEASEGWLHVRATDGELALFTQTPTEGDLPQCTIPCGELIRRLKASRNATCGLTLSDDGERLIVNGGRVEHALLTLDANDFPVVASGHAGDSLTIDAAELCHALQIASPAVAREPSRYAIDGVLLESDEKGTRLVATDGRRLVVVGLHSVETEFEGRAILPHRMMKLIEKFADKHTDYLVLAVQRDTTDDGKPLPARLFAAGPDWLLSAYESDGRFPIYRDVVPASHSKFTVERRALVEALSEVALTTNEDNRMVCLNLCKQEVRLSAAAVGIGKSTAALPAEFLGGGDAEIHTAFNPAYLLDALKTLSCSTVVIDIDQNGYGCDGKVFGKPMLLYAQHEPGTRWVIMPVNAKLEPTRENLGSNFPEGLEEEVENA